MHQLEIMSSFTGAKDIVEMKSLACLDLINELLYVVCVDLAGERRVHDHISIRISCWV